MRIEIRAANRGFTWALVAKNGKQTANNEVFANQSSATRAAKAVITSILRTAKCTTKLEWARSTSEDGMLILTAKVVDNG